jgi:hypothetical protein
MACARGSAAITLILAGGDPQSALGLDRGPGGRSPIERDREERRDAELRRWRARHYAHLSCLAAASAMTKEWDRYSLQAARSDSALPDLPDSYRGRPREHCFVLMRIGSTWPSERSLRRILPAS